MLAHPVYLNCLSFTSFLLTPTTDSPQRNKKHKRSKSDADLDRDSQVIALTDQNAKALLNTRNVDIFVEFFAPWCVHCQELKPELRSTANAFKNVRFNSAVILSLVLCGVG